MAIPSFTATWHTDTYSAIDPANPALSVKGKKIIITGGGSGIGCEIVKAFATAGAGSIAILGRRQSLLDKTKKLVEDQYKDVHVTAYCVDISNVDQVRAAAKAIGAWDVIVLNAGYLSTPATIVDTDVDDWWRCFEINIKGNFLMVQAFLPQRNKDAAIVGASSGAVSLSSTLVPQLSSYMTAKLGLVRFYEALAAQAQDVHVVTYHPGNVNTDMSIKSGAPEEVLTDAVALGAHFVVWLVSPEARFLRGKFVWANWDVDELKKKAKEIQDSLVLTTNIIGWPFKP